MSLSQETCEDFSGLPCMQDEVVITEVFSEAWDPVQFGQPVVLVYIDPETQDWAWHVFSDALDPNDLDDVLNNPPTNQVVQQLAQGGSSLLGDPEDDFIVISGAQFTGRGIVQKTET